MHRVTVHDEEYLAGNAVQQRLQEVNETTRVHALLMHPETKFPPWRYRRHHVYRLPLAGFHDDRGLAHGTPRGPAVVVRPHAGLVLEEDARALLGSEPADLRVDGFLPFGHASRVLLISAVKRTLR